MYCKKCGLAVMENQVFCANCGAPAGRSLAQENEAIRRQGRFEDGMRRLGRFWYLFAGLNVALGLAGMTMLGAGLTQAQGPWEPWPHPPAWDWTMMASVAWTLLASRIVIASVAGWALLNHFEWGRVVAMFAAAVACLEFPIGVAMAVFTSIQLLGKQHAAEYRHWVGAR